MQSIFIKHLECFRQCAKCKILNEKQKSSKYSLNEGYCLVGETCVNQIITKINNFSNCKKCYEGKNPKS